MIKIANAPCSWGVLEFDLEGEAAGYQQVLDEMIDTAVITLHFENGAIGTIDNSRQAVYGYDRRVEVFGSGGMVTVLNNTPDTHVYSAADGIHSAKLLIFKLPNRPLMSHNVRNDNIHPLPFFYLNRGHHLFNAFFYPWRAPSSAH